MEIFDLNGVRLAALVSGTAGAMPLLLLHGGGSDKSTWDGVAPAFGTTHRVYALDLRGFGESDRPGTYSFEAMRDDVLGVLDTIGADRADVIGHSMGGSVAWLVAQEQPERIAHLVIEDTPPPRHGMVRSPLGPPPEDPPFDWEALVAIVGQLQEPDPRWWARIADVTAPTLVLAGGPTSHVPQNLFAEVLSMLPHGDVVEVAAGHQIHRDAPERFIELVTAFLAR